MRTKKQSLIEISNQIVSSSNHTPSPLGLDYMTAMAVLTSYNHSSGSIKQRLSRMSVKEFMLTTSGSNSFSVD